MISLCIRACLQALLIASMVMAVSPSFAQDAPTNLRSMIKLLAEGASGPPTPIADLAWLEGHWIGEMPEGPVEHVILSPKFGHMPGFVRAVSPKGVLFYEISVFAQAGDSVTVKVKHFTPLLAGWEAQDAFIDRPLVDRDAKTLFFDGITFSRTGQDSFTVYFLNRSGQEERETLVIPFRRK
jgi:hypothetical protein